MTFRRSSAIWCCAAILLAAVPAAAKDAASIVIRAGKSDGANHALARQFAEAVAIAVNGTYTLDVQESQSSVQNVIDAMKPPYNVVFTAGPDVIAAAQRGAKPFPPNPRYRDVRALFPMPAMTLHWIVRQDSGIRRLDDLASHAFISGAKGSVGERLTTTTLHVLGIDREVQLMDINAAAAPAALKAGQISGIAIAGAYPAPAVLDLATALPIRLLGLARPALAKITADDDSTMAEVVPKGTYPGVDQDVTTLALPVGVYTTRHMRAATAYALTKAFWSQHDALAKRDPPWQAVNFAALADLKVKLHAGALRYYREAKAPVPKGMR